MTAYYNEIDPIAAQWLRNLIAAGLIAPGVVDERSIEDVRPDELRGYTQCHFFAGIGVWSYALRRAGWPDDRPVWTGSCPCQPFSTAGKGSGFADERHLWPAFHHLIRECGPAVVFGEQVASKDADPWIDLVQTDMEALGYAFGAIAFPSAGIGAPHIRDRLYWLGDTDDQGSQGHGWHGARSGQPGRHLALASGPAGAAGLSVRMADPTGGGLHGWGIGVAGHGADPARIEPQRLRHACGLADPDGGRCGTPRPSCAGFQDPEQCCGADGLADSPGWRRFQECTDAGGCTGRDCPQGGAAGSVPGRTDGGLADADDGRLQEAGREPCERAGEPGAGQACGAPGPVNGHWRAADWLFCQDGKWRAVEPGTFPLAHGAPARVGRLRAYGNAINAEAAVEVILAYRFAKVELQAA